MPGEFMSIKGTVLQVPGTSFAMTTCRHVAAPFQIVQFAPHTVWRYRDSPPAVLFYQRFAWRGARHLRVLVRQVWDEAWGSGRVVSDEDIFDCEASVRKDKTNERLLI
jgi:hypothetical protein